MLVESSLFDEAVIWGVLEYTSSFGTIDAVSRLSGQSDWIGNAIKVLASAGHTLSFDGPRDDVRILENELLSEIIKLCNRAEVHSDDFKYVCSTVLFPLYPYVLRFTKSSVVS